MADCNQIVPLPMKLVPSSVMSWKKEAKYILNRKRVLRVCKSHFYSAKHFIAPAFKKVPYLVFDPDIFIFLRDEVNGIKTILLCTLSFLPKHNPEWLSCYSEMSSIALLSPFVCFFEDLFSLPGFLFRQSYCQKKNTQKFDWTMAILTMRKITE